MKNSDILIWNAEQDCDTVSSNSTIGFAVNDRPSNITDVSAVFVYEGVYVAQIWNGEGWVFQTITEQDNALYKAIQDRFLCRE